MESKRIRQQFLDFFQGKGHQIVPSSPIVNKDDPTLLFTNSGMNQFKDIFTGSKPVVHARIADTQKCLRVSGKHNDLEDVGFDTYHHTMFEMLGNWSFGDYFKAEAIAWAWEFITEVLKIDKDRLYVTVFEGSPAEHIPIDNEAIAEWAKVIDRTRILPFNKKANFWEMGETGPCGPCTELHYDARPDEDRKKIDGATLVNADHPQVIEIWNLVFMQFNRKADGSLQPLPAPCVDTGMGFERLCMVLQNQKSTYDTDVFAALIAHIEQTAKVKYTGQGAEAMQDVAIRVVVDHIRAIAFAIADGQLPSNTGAGYVIRRILRRASRYGFQYLGLHQPFLYQLVGVLVDYFGDTFAELKAQQDFITRIIEQEEKSFIEKLERGSKMFEDYKPRNKTVEGQFAFSLFDTYGFPLDLTQLMAKEKGWTVDQEGFDAAMQEQKARSKAAGKVQAGDWVLLQNADTLFVGYDTLHCATELVRHRTVKTAKGQLFQVVLTHTPFYAESGGQVGDTGTLTKGAEVLQVLDTQKENDLIVHLVDKLPNDAEGEWQAQVNKTRRRRTEANHSATHLLHAALRRVLGTHVEQRGSLVNDSLLRFDFSHFQKMTADELQRVEAIVNEKIVAGIAVQVAQLPIAEAKARGAMALFGEKYGDVVRVVTLDPSYSVELCGGTHVDNSLRIRLFNITSEGSSAAGIRRIEALTGEGALAHLHSNAAQLAAVSEALKHPQKLEKAVIDLVEQNRGLVQRIEKMRARELAQLRQELLQQASTQGSLRVLVSQVAAESADELKALSYDLRKQLGQCAIVLGCVADDKPLLSVILSEELTTNPVWDARKIIKEIAAEIQGGGGGQAFYATAGGKNAAGLSKALDKAKAVLAGLAQA